MSALLTAPALDFDRFLGLLGESVGRDIRHLDVDARLGDDLPWDSLDMVAALALLDDHGVHLPDELPGELRTLGDLYHYLDVLWGSSPPPERDQFHGPNVHLIPVNGGHADYLHQLCTVGDHLTHFRLRGMTPSPDAFHRFIWERSVAQFIVATESTAVGWVSSFEPDFRNRHMHIAAVADPEHEASGLVAEGAALLVSYLFTQFDVRKVYAETLAVNFERFCSGQRWMFEVEGRLVDHEYLDGEYHDFLTLAAHREPWRQVHRRLFRSEPQF